MQPCGRGQAADAATDHYRVHNASSTGVEDSTPVECVFVERVDVIADAAISVIAAEGMRGLTHRAVDRAAGLPVGSTSYYARTRAALLELTITRIVVLDQVPLAGGGGGGLAEFVAEYAFEAITAGRTRMLARYEFALEATRRPELRAVYDEGGLQIRHRAASVLEAAGSPEPERHARVVVDWMEGTIFGALAGTGSLAPPGLEELLASAREILAGIVVG
ncbi:TetR/AcrR family transcriptional regulator [Amycolatopsis sp. A133]|uniref:TetR/AcrR family transcriptional regulator n=1 Tax=Amycolatopsis sp. A133 TaxID=3064472 RepID=UPI0027FDDC1D|nr:TetR/AcrR family transcriptional regulator [Amycolatopsis sp. A133]MDQ7805747.1 TetR/AcrR family transcriptional regulator [Amycolatopsis sp. A133]